MNKAFYAGSFDPFTNGHLHVVKVAAKMFNEVIIGFAVNPDKKKRVNQDLMILAVEETLKEENLTNVKVVRFHDKTAARTAVKTYGAMFLIRGVRNGADYEYEENLAKINEEIINELETVYIRAGKTSHVSSSAVMELFKYNEDISNWVPGPVLRLLNTMKN